MITYINLSGAEIQINDTRSNIEAAEKAGWTKKESKPKKKTIKQDK